MKCVTIRTMVQGTVSGFGERIERIGSRARRIPFNPFRTCPKPAAGNPLTAAHKRGGVR
jgi:hypothetical protein